MKAPFSEYLTLQAPMIRRLIEELAGEYDYVSVLSADSTGFRVQVNRHDRKISHSTLISERGHVVRVARDGLYGEYAFNEPDPAGAGAMAERIRAALDQQLELLRRTGTNAYETGLLPDEELTLFVEKETGSLPEDTDPGQLAEQLAGVCEQGLSCAPHAVECIVTAQSTHISKMFQTMHRDLRQSYLCSEGSVSVICGDGAERRTSHEGISGCVGPELFEGLGACAETAAGHAEEQLGASRVAPGEYDIITTPGVSGLIAHEAFGHGVEMDMFVKNRALGKDYIDKRVASDLVTMHEGALVAESVTAYAFDDEGTLAGDVTEIDAGILKSGICDALSALRLGTVPTGNGKRQNFAHKAYTRMTNTVFASGSSTLDEMIASVQHGYLLDGVQSGMEDPKHWGIQCMIERGYEIRDGKLTGRVAAPVILTGYVPDLLGSVSMLSGECEVSGNGACGKGWKEWVKVADGGPCLKARARLG